jgi:signal transduction histidine kinase
MTPAAAPRTASRAEVVRAYVVQGIAGLALMVVMTILRAGEVSQILGRLGGSGVLLVLVFFVFCLTLSFLKFPLTEDIFVSFAMIAFTAMIPLLGMVMSVWIACTAVILNRVFDIVGIGPHRIESAHPPTEWARTFGLFGTYGIPIVAAAMIYQAIGGVTPLVTPSIASAGKVTVMGLSMISVNSLIMFRVQRAYGYPFEKIVRSTLTDMGILALGIPFAFMMTFSYTTAGWFGVAAVGFTGVIGNWVVRSLAMARTANQKLVERLSSLTNIGKSISISGSRDELLWSIYSECRRVVDAGIFAITLVDPHQQELSIELYVENDQLRPKFRVPMGRGLNSWVVEQGRTLLIRTSADERLKKIGVVDDGLATESWLGVPMIVHDRVIGTISVQSFRRHAFNEDDDILLTAVANQAAVAIENAHLYQDLESLYLALEERVEERTLELRETNIRLVAADSTKSRFLAHMSHELRTPLNSIIGFSRILLEKLKAQIPPRLYGFIENIQVSGTHLLGLINEILDLSKIEAGRMELQVDRFALPETIRGVERVIRGMAAEEQVVVVTTIDEDVGEVTLDEGRLKQILINLLSNAVKFSPEKEYVRLHASKLAPEESPLGVESIRIEVRDRGPGVEPEELPRIFDEFYQVLQAQPRSTNGTGLGLPLAKRFVDLHNGRIDAESTPEGGSVFRVYLPVDVTAVAAREEVGR